MERLKRVNKKKAVKFSPPCNKTITKRIGLEGLFFKAFIAEPHHAADLAARGHHLCRLHGLGAALGYVQVDHCLFCSRFSGFTHFCHDAFTSG
jgi:hypothetical protein